MTDYCSDLAKDSLDDPNPSVFAEYLRHSKEYKIRGLIHGMSGCQELKDLVNRKIEDIFKQQLTIDLDTWKAWKGAIDRFRFLERSVKFEGNSEEYVDPEKVQQEINNTLAILMRDSLIMQVQTEFWQTGFSTISKIVDTLKKNIESGKITIPTIEEDSICDFIQTHIKDKEGEDIKRETIKRALSRK
jgi:hypothetical protein